MSEILKSKELLIGLTSISFLICFLPYFINMPPIEALSLQTVEWSLTIAYFIAITAIISVTRRNLYRATNRSRGWYYGIITLILMYYMIIVGFSLGTEHAYFNFFFKSIYSSLEPMANAIIFFSLAAASARSFRLRDSRSAVLLVTAVLVLMKNAPIGNVIWGGFQPIGNFLYDYIVSSGNRAFGIGTSVAGILVTLRVLIGREKSTLGIKEE